MSENLILKLLVGSIFFFLAALFYAEHRFPNDGQLFQVIASLVSGFSGAFLMFIKNKLGVVDPPPPGTIRTTDVEAKSVTTEVTPPQDK